MTKPHIGIIISSTREGRFADKPAAWFENLAKKREALTFEQIDLRDYPMRHFAEAKSPAIQPPDDPAALAWGRKLGGCDGFVVITAEYNHAPTGAIKNALDHAYHEFKHKPIAFVGYGGVGAARAIEQLRLIAIELQLVPTKTGVHIAMAEFMGAMQGKSFDEYPYLEKAANTLLDEVQWWSSLLKTAREKS